MHVADELLRDGARPAALAEDVVLERARDSNDVDSVVLVEAVILDRDERLREVLGQRPDRNAGANLLADLADQGAIAPQNERCLGDGNNGPGLGVDCLRLLGAQ